MPLAVLLLAMAPPSLAVSVDAKRNVYAAAPGGVALNGGGALPVQIPVPRGATRLRITAEGSVSCCEGGAGTFNGANGGTTYSTEILSSNGISGITARGRSMFLTGVFVGARMQSTPAALDVTDSERQGSVRPQLDQTFFVGDGYFVGSREIGVRTIWIPRGATALALGFAASATFGGPPGGYDDFTGTLTVHASFSSKPR